MSALYESIPPDQIAQYEANAEAAYNEATQPVWEALGGVAINRAESIVAGEESPGGPIDEAEKLLELDARGSELADETEDYIRELPEKVVAAAEKIAADSANTTIGDVAERYAHYQESPWVNPNSKIIPKLKDRKLPDSQARYNAAQALFGNHNKRMIHLTEEEKAAIADLYPPEDNNGDDDGSWI